MAAERVAGRRRVIDDFWSPVAKAISKAWRLIWGHDEIAHMTHLSLG